MEMTMWSEAFTVPVTNDSLADLVSVGNYGAVADVYRRMRVVSQPKRDGAVIDCVKMYTYTTPRRLWLCDVVLELERMGRRGATAHELLQFGAVVRSESTSGTIVAIGSYESIGGFRGFAMISGAMLGEYFAGRNDACWFHKGAKILALQNLN